MSSENTAGTVTSTAGDSRMERASARLKLAIFSQSPSIADSQGSRTDHTTVWEDVGQSVTRLEDEDPTKGQGSFQPEI